MSKSFAFILLFDVLPKYSFQKWLKAAFNWFQKQQAHMHIEGVIISPHFCDIISSEARLEKMHQGLTPVLWLMFSACARNVTFLHTISAHAMTFPLHLIKCRDDQLQHRLYWYANVGSYSFNSLKCFVGYFRVYGLLRSLPQVMHVMNVGCDERKEWS